MIDGPASRLDDIVILLLLTVPVTVVTYGSVPLYLGIILIVHLLFRRVPSRPMAAGLATAPALAACVLVADLIWGRDLPLALALVVTVVASVAGLTRILAHRSADRLRRGWRVKSARSDPKNC